MRCRLVPLLMAATLCILAGRAAAQDKTATAGKKSPAENEAAATPAKSEIAVQPTGASAPQGGSADGTNQDSASRAGEFGSVNRSESSDESGQRDPAFERFVDLGLLAKGMADLDASLLADIALGLAEGERVLMRTHHSGLTADALIVKVAALAHRRNDEKTIKRVMQAADTLKKPAWKEALTKAAEFGTGSRAPAPSIPITSLDPETAAFVRTVTETLDAATVFSSKGDLERLKGAVTESVKNEKVRAYLLQRIDESSKAIPKEMQASDELLAEFSAGSRDDSNRNEVRANLERDGWSVIWGKNFTEGDWIQGTASIAESIATENPGPFLRWFSSVLEENFNKIQANLGGVARRDIERWIVESLKTKRIITYRGLAIEAGFATYDRWQRVVYHEPATVETWWYVGPIKTGSSAEFVGKNRRG